MRQVNLVQVPRQFQLGDEAADLRGVVLPAAPVAGRDGPDQLLDFPVSELFVVIKKLAVLDGLEVQQLQDILAELLLLEDFAQVSRRE